MPSRLISSFIVIALFLVGFGVQSGWVVCYGDDGHVAIEKLQSNDCIDIEEEFAHSPDHQEIRSSHCGQCTDVPLVLTAREIDRVLDLTRLIQFENNIATAAFVVTPVLESLKSQGALPQPPPLSSKLLAIRRTIVLQI